MALFPSHTPLFVVVVILGWLLFKLLRIGRREPDLPPGPKTVPLFGNLLEFPTVNAFIKFDEWAQTYGDIFSFKAGSHDIIVLTSPEAIREVLDNHQNVTADRPAHFIAHAVTDGLHLPFMREGPIWKILRRAVREILSPQACARHTMIQRAESARLMYDLLRDPQSFYTHFQRYALSVIMSVTFQKAMPTITSPDTKAFIRNAHIFNRLMKPGGTPPMDLLPMLQYLPSWFGAGWKPVVRDLKQRHREFYGALFKTCEEAAMEGRENHSFMQSVCEKAEELSMTRDMTMTFGQAILETGADTSAAWLQQATKLLVVHPEIQSKAHEELDRVIGSDRSPTFDDIPNLPYLRAIIEEVHRLRPVAPLSIPHATQEDIYYKGYKIPKGAMIVPNLYGVGHSTQLYDNPTQFDPDRFMHHPYGVKQNANYGATGDGDAEVQEKGQSGLMQKGGAPLLKDFPYGFGKRACPGMLLAKNTLSLNLANLLWGFDILKAKDAKGQFIEPNLTDFIPQLVLATPPFKCNIVVRSARHAEVIRQNFLDSTPTFAPFEVGIVDEDKAFLANLRERAANGL